MEGDVLPHNLDITFLFNTFFNSNSDIFSLILFLTTSISIATVNLYLLVSWTVFLWSPGWYCHYQPTDHDWHRKLSGQCDVKHIL